MKNRTARLLSLSVALCSLYALGKCEDCSEPGPSGVVIVEAFNGVIATGTPELAGHACLLVHSPITMPEVPFTNGSLCVAPFVPGAGRGEVTFFDQEGRAFPALPPAGHYTQLWHRNADGEGDLSQMIQIGG